MSKVSIDFQISYPLHHKVIRDMRVVTEKVGELTVTGTAYCNPSILQGETSERYSVDIDFIRFNGEDIRPVLVVTGGYEEVEEYCTRQAHKLFTPKTQVA